ncbi:MAG: glycosyltransferase 87 family protein [Candidatus Bathyarchaeia archaeon]|jgi:hypothetical protein
MTSKLPSAKTIFVIAVAVVIALNLYTLVLAYPQTYTPSHGITPSAPILAKDFSAYYMGAWRLWHNPSHIYTSGSLNDGEPVILPHPETYKYLPSFLLLVSPFLSLSYQQALTAFDIVQFLMLPLMAYFIYKILSDKPLAVTFIVILIALFLPLPFPQWGFSPSYYWQWGEGQAKVFITFLLLLSFYLGWRGKPVLSGVAFAFGFFDPRFGLLAIPLFVSYNRKNLKLASASAVVSVLLSNGMLLVSGIGSGFLSMVFSNAVATPLFYYSYIPLVTLSALIAVNFKEEGRAFGLIKTKSRPKNTEKPQKD